MTAGVTVLDKFKGNYIRGTLKISQTINETIEARRMRWYGHVKRREKDHVVAITMNNEMTRARRKGRPKES